MRGGLLENVIKTKLKVKTRVQQKTTNFDDSILFTHIGILSDNCNLKRTKTWRSVMCKYKARAS